MERMAVAQSRVPECSMQIISFPNVRAWLTASTLLERALNSVSQSHRVHSCNTHHHKKPLMCSGGHESHYKKTDSPLCNAPDGWRPPVVCTRAQRPWRVRCAPPQSHHSCAAAPRGFRLSHRSKMNSHMNSGPLLGEIHTTTKTHTYGETHLRCLTPMVTAPGRNDWRHPCGGHFCAAAAPGGYDWHHHLTHSSNWM